MSNCGGFSGRFQYAMELAKLVSFFRFFRLNCLQNTDTFLQFLYSYPGDKVYRTQVPVGYNAAVVMAWRLSCSVYECRLWHDIILQVHQGGYLWRMRRPSATLFKKLYRQTRQILPQNVEWRLQILSVVREFKLSRLHHGENRVSSSLVSKSTFQLRSRVMNHKQQLTLNYNWR